MRASAYSARNATTGSTVVARRAGTTLARTVRARRANATAAYVLVSSGVNPYSIDESDRACMGHALELAGEGKTVVWKNAARGVTYRLTPTRNVGDRRNPCREFRTVVAHGKKRETVNGVACRRGGGEWFFKT